jgi:hypothetical protein
MKKRFQKQLKHALILKVSLHGKNPHLTHFVGNKKNKNQTQIGRPKP